MRALNCGRNSLASCNESVLVCGPRVVSGPQSPLPNALPVDLMATPPPVHSSAVLIGPDVDLATLPWYQFYERRSLGRVLGLSLIGAGVATFTAVSKPWTWFPTAPSTKFGSHSKPSHAWIPLSLSLVALIVGIRLRIRKYYKDPEAVREYIHLFHNSSFSVAFKELDSWDGLLRST